MPMPTIVPIVEHLKMIIVGMLSKHTENKNVLYSG